MTNPQKINNNDKLPRWLFKNSLSSVVTRVNDNLTFFNTDLSYLRTVVAYDTLVYQMRYETLPPVLGA